MKKLNLAIIGQGRSGRNIHGAFLKKEEDMLCLAFEKMFLGKIKF